MRKKTIEEELKEISEEKEEHIEKLHNKARKSKDNHSYDFCHPEFEVDEETTDKKETETDENTADEIQAEFEEYDKTNVESTVKLQTAVETTNKTSSRRGGSIVLSSIVALIFIMVGLGVSLFGGIIPWIKSASYIEVPATVIDVDYYYDDDHDLMAKMTYTYEFEGQLYTKKASYSQSANISPSVGEIITIRVNPNNPEDVLDSVFLNIILTFFGLVFFLVGSILFIILIRSKIKSRG